MKKVNKNEKYIKSFFINSLKRKGFDKGKITPNQIFTDFKKNLNLKLNFTQFKKIWASCLTGLNKDMEKLLYRLRKNYKLILLSNTDTIHFEHCRKKYRVLDIFDDFVLSYKVGYKKPNPLIYLHTIKKAKTSPNKTAYIDDIQSYVRYAGFLGIKGIKYKNIQKLKTDLKKLNIEI